LTYIPIFDRSYQQLINLNIPTGMELQAINVTSLLPPEIAFSGKMAVFLGVLMRKSVFSRGKWVFWGVFGLEMGVLRCENGVFCIFFFFFTMKMENVFFFYR
jgi:hypothetical protein